MLSVIHVGWKIVTLYCFYLGDNFEKKLIKFPLKFPSTFLSVERFSKNLFQLKLGIVFLIFQTSPFCNPSFHGNILVVGVEIS